ncbi:MAG: hypothetical protein IKW58_00420 [Alphaproteobacteria bacterium]|nr:hypothetical protein [Alphaproteobacteria bacterium]
MKKILLFNYFVEKCAKYKQSLLGVSPKEAMLSLVFSHSHVMHSFKSGTSLVEIYLTNRRYVGELFLMFCLEAEKRGKNILQQFSFHCKDEYRHGSFQREFIDDDIDKYLNQIYPPLASKLDIDFPMYESITKLSAEKLLEKSYHLGNLCQVSNHSLEQPEFSSETQMIDEVWEQLEKNSVFFRSLNSQCLVNHFAQSNGNLMLKEHYSQELKRYVG